MKNLSVIVTHYQTPHLLFRLLKNLNKPATSPSQVFFENLGGQGSEIIVIDSKGQKGTRLVMGKEFPWVNYIPFAKNVGYAKLVNTGIKKAKGRYLLIINADIEIGLKSIGKMHDFLEGTKDAVAVGVSDCFRFPTASALLARRTPWKHTLWGKRALEHYEMKEYKRDAPCTVDWVRGDCWMLRTRALKTVGPFDERFFLYFEDTDWCRRAKEKGLSVYFLPGIKVFHAQAGASRQFTLKGIFFYRLAHVISLFKYLWKWRKHPPASRF